MNPSDNNPIIQNHIHLLEKFLPIEIKLKRELKELKASMKESKIYIQEYLINNNLNSIQINDVVIKLKKNKNFSLSSKQLDQCKIDPEKKQAIKQLYTKKSVSLQY